MDADGSLYLYFDPVMDVNDFSGDIAAGTPYIVKWGTKDNHPTTDIVNPVFQGVTVTSTNPDFDTTKEGRDDATGLGNVTFRGTFAPEPIYANPATNLFLGAGNTLYWPSTDGYNIGPFRAYFELGNGLTAGEPSSPNGVRAFSLNFGDGSEETGIVEITDPTPSPSPAWEGRSATWFSMDGLRLEGKPKARGIYINNGKKVVIK